MTMSPPSAASSMNVLIVFLLITAIVNAVAVPSGRVRLATDDFKGALQHAHEAAEDPRLRHGCVGTEHLLLGVLAVPESTGAQALANVSVTAQDVRARVERELGSGEGP